MPKSSGEIATALAALIGESSVIGDVADMASYTIEPHSRFDVQPAAVALPRSVPDVQKVMAWANDNRVPVIPQGGNTGLVGGQVPKLGGEVILSLSRLNAIRAIDARAGHVTAEAGTILQNLHEAVEAHDMIFPLWLPSQGSARLGGVLSTNAGGVQVIAYGSTRDLCLGVEAVLADGRLYQGLNSLKKNNTGYDLRHLLVGAEGTLAVITAATMKLYPRPVAYETALVNIDTVERGLELMALMRARAGSTLTAFELIPRIAIDIHLRYDPRLVDPAASVSPWYILTEISQPRGAAPGVLQAALEAAFEAGLISDAVVADSLAQRKTLWHFREHLSEPQKNEGGAVRLDISVPISSVPRLIEEGTAAANRIAPGVRPLPIGHFGDGNIHFNFLRPLDWEPERLLAVDGAICAAVYDVALKLNGSISAEHGIGQIKADLLKTIKDPVALEMMRAIKRALDPNGILNPGKVLV